MTHPTKRFARLRHGGRHSATTTYLAAEPGFVPDRSNHGVLAKVAEEDPERAARIEEGLRTLLAHDHDVMTWLEADPEHAALFARDPAAALREAVPALGASFFDGWKA